MNRFTYCDFLVLLEVSRSDVGIGDLQEWGVYLTFLGVFLQVNPQFHGLGIPNIALALIICLFPSCK